MVGDWIIKELNLLFLDKYYLFIFFVVYISLLFWFKNIEVGFELNEIFWCWFIEEVLVWKGI